MSGDGELNTSATRSDDASSAASQESPLTTTEPSSYSSQDITVLEGLEAVRKRPGMYIGSTGPTGLHHLVWEVVDNSVDEAMAGHCSRIDVSILPDGGIEVRDDGRGIPVGKHPKYEDLTAAEVVLTVLHAGGKFGGDGYKVSGGLHGVGISVVNALSARVEVEIDRDGKRHAMSFGDGGELKDRLAVAGDAPTDTDGTSRTGTTVRFWPDGSIFDETDYRFQTLQERFQMMAFLNRSRDPCSRSTARCNRRDRRPRWVVQLQVRRRDHGFRHPCELFQEALFQAVGYFAGAETIDDNPHEVEIAFQWNTGFNSDGLHSFANGITTGEGGMHEEGFRKSLTNVVNRYAFDKNILKDGKDDRLQGEDIREGLTAIISVRLREPQFEGQTKGKLGNVSMRSLVEKVTNEDGGVAGGAPDEGKAIVTKATNAARARVAAADARKAIRSKSLLDGAGSPTSSRTAPQRNLSVANSSSLRVTRGSAVRARDPETQAILPIEARF